MNNHENFGERPERGWKNPQIYTEEVKNIFGMKETVTVAIQGAFSPLQLKEDGSLIALYHT